MKGAGRVWAVYRLALAGALGNCAPTETATTTDYLYYEDPYLYDYYYTADLAYTGYYWANAWDYALYVYQANGEDASTTQRWGVGNAIRRLARGEPLCPGRVTVTPKVAAAACGGPDAAPVRSGVTIVFDRCGLPGGGSLRGTFEVEATRAATEPSCGPATEIRLAATATSTGLAITGPSGSRLVIPDQRDTATGTYLYGQPPGPVAIDSKGRLQIYDAAGTLLHDHDHQGTRLLTYGQQDHSYSIAGTITVQDRLRPDGAATLVGGDVTRGVACCRPTAGTLDVDRTGGDHPGRHAWRFGPGCGQASYDDAGATLPACM